MQIYRGSFLRKPIHEFLNLNNEQININLFKIENNFNYNMQGKTEAFSNDKNNFSSFSRYTKAAKTILINQGDTSYFNAVLQFIGSIRNLASFFLNPENSQNIYNNLITISVSFVIQKLFLHLYPFPEKEENEIYSAISILKVLGTLNNIYKDTKKKNPNVLIRFILDILDKELNKPQQNFKKLTADIHVKNNIIECRIRNYTNLYSSIISKILFSFNFPRKKRVNLFKCPNFYFKYTF